MEAWISATSQTLGSMRSLKEVLNHEFCDPLSIIEATRIRFDTEVWQYNNPAFPSQFWALRDCHSCFFGVTPTPY